MSEYKNFIFKDYVFDKSTKTLSLYYSIDDQINFLETYHFDFDYIDYNPKALNKAIETLFFMAGVSYFKTFVPENIEIQKGSLDKREADFFSKTYQRGLGEFWYVNSLDPNTPVSFPSISEPSETISLNNSGLLIGLGGGKDSLVIVEALLNKDLDVSTWSLNHQTQFEPLVNRTKLNHYYVNRTIDIDQLTDLKSLGALNGHIPISAIFAAVGSVVAVLAGKRDVVVGNEQTANEPTLNYQGVDINHQYSKTQEFERDFQDHLRHSFGDSMRYYSFLRPLTELRIAEVFAKLGFDKYLGVFSSCNRAYTLHSHELFWCGECSKCAFIFLIFTPFVERELLESLWNGKNLLLDEQLKPTYRQLLGIDGDKPLDCVGEVKESRAAMRLAQKVYPELESEYTFDLPEDYNYKALASDEMPEEIKKLFTDFINQF
jgi:7-cyano-7-deazaguanine synthase in queuosine biosynthesis